MASNGGPLEFSFDIPINVPGPADNMGYPKPAPPPRKPIRPIRNPIKPPKDVPVGERPKYNVKSTGKAKFIRGVKDASGRGVGGKYAPKGSRYTAPAGESGPSQAKPAKSRSVTQGNRSSRKKAARPPSRKPPVKRPKTRDRVPSKIRRGPPVKPPRKPTKPKVATGQSSQRKGSGQKARKTRIRRDSLPKLPPLPPLPGITGPRGTAVLVEHINIEIHATVPLLEASVLAETRRQLSRRIPELTLRQGATLLLAILRRNAPRRSGRLASSLDVELGHKGAGHFSVLVGQRRGIAAQSLYSARRQARGRFSTLRSVHTANARDAVPLHFVTSPTKPHVISPRRGGSLSINGRQVRGSVRHPGTRGNDFVRQSIREFEGQVKGALFLGAGASASGLFGRTFRTKSVTRDLRWNVRFN